VGAPTQLRMRMCDGSVQRMPVCKSRRQHSCVVQEGFGFCSNLGAWAHASSWACASSLARPMGVSNVQWWVWVFKGEKLF